MQLYMQVQVLQTAVRFTTCKDTCEQLTRKGMLAAFIFVMYFVYVSLHPHTFKLTANWHHTACKTVQAMGHLDLVLQARAYN